MKHNGTNEGNIEFSLNVPACKSMRCADGMKNGSNGGECGMLLVPKPRKQSMSIINSS